MIRPDPRCVKPRRVVRGGVRDPRRVGRRSLSRPAGRRAGGRRRRAPRRPWPSTTAPWPPSSPRCPSTHALSLGCRLRLRGVSALVGLAFAPLPSPSRSPCPWPPSPVGAVASAWRWSASGPSSTRRPAPWGPCSCAPSPRYRCGADVTIVTRRALGFGGARSGTVRGRRAPGRSTGASTASVSGADSLVGASPARPRRRHRVVPGARPAFRDAPLGRRLVAAGSSRRPQR